MKNFLLLWLMLGWAIAAAADQNDETPIVNKKPTQAEMESGKAKYAKIQNALPLEQREVVYLSSDKEWSSLSPAYIDLSNSTAYKWKDVTLQPNQIPDLAGTRAGSGTIMPVDPQESGYQVKEIDPPIRYVALGDSGKYGAGYYDPTHRIFYRWGNLEYDLNQLPADAKSKNLILASTSIAKTSSIAPPSKDAPKPPGVTTPTAPNDQTSSTSDHPASTVSPQSAPPPPQTPKPIAEVASASDTGIPWWLYGIIVLSIAIIAGGGWYVLRPKK